MSRFADSRDPNGIGILVLQHHGYDQKGFDLALRGGLLGVRVIDRDDKTGGLGSWKRDPGADGDVRNSVGDLNLAFLWPKDKRQINGWAFAWPVTIQQGKDVASKSAGGDTCAKIGNLEMLPLRGNEWKADDRYKQLKPKFPVKGNYKLWPKFPKGFFGLALTATNEEKQIEYFLPTDPRLIAVNRKGDSAMGSLVCDMGDGFEIDPDRMARLQSAWRVVRPKSGCVSIPNDPDRPGKKLNALAWQLGPAGCDGAWGHGLVIDRGSNDAPPDVATQNQFTVNGVTYAMYGQTSAPVQTINPYTGQPTTSWIQNVPIDPSSGADNSSRICGLSSRFETGPLDVGGGKDKHQIGKTEDGEAINSVHISTAALIKEPGTERDAPFFFEGAYIQPAYPPFLVATHLRYDGLDVHSHVCGARFGKWKWESRCFLYSPGGGDGGRFSFPTIPTRGTSFRTPGTPTGGTGGILDPNRLGIPGSPSETGRPQGEIVPVDPFFRGTIQSPADARAPASIEVYDRPKIWGAGDPPQYFAATTLQTAFPVILWRPQNLFVNRQDLRIAQNIVPQELAIHDRYSPIVGRFEAWAVAQTTGFGSYTQTQDKSRWIGGTASGGILMLPPEVSIDDHGSNFAPAGVTVSDFCFLAAPGTCFGTGLPDFTTGGIKTGYHWKDSSGALVWNQVNSSGTETEVARYDSSGNLGFKTASPAAAFHVGTSDVRIDLTRPALGGGAGATLGTIGGSGPGTAGQNAWAQIKLGTTTYYIPIWR